LQERFAYLEWSIMVIENKPGCIATTARVLGDKWTPLILRALALQPQRFCRLQEEAGGINPRTLSARLSALEQQEIIMKVARHPMSAHFEYRLTRKGTDLLPVLMSMATWGEKYSAKARVAPEE
jgi:DNA-binding HxlR family transcriptional regulator